MGYEDHPHPLAKDLRGKRFGRLIVKELASVNPRKWLVVCDCGSEKVVIGSNVLNGRTLSCGCLWLENCVGPPIKHGHDRAGKATKTYRCWSGMWTRCRGSSKASRHRYVDRGITVDPRWKSFENFLSDMGEAPPGLSLDRIDNDQAYGPGNCRWADNKQQARNRGNTRWVTAFDKTMSVVEWSEKTGLESATIIGRLNSGWKPEDALTRPVRHKNFVPRRVA